MEQDHKKKLTEIIDGLKCPKDFRCYKQGFENLCKARNIGLDSHLECLEENPYGCVFSLSFGNTYLCRCPLRIYLCRELYK